MQRLVVCYLCIPSVRQVWHALLSLVVKFHVVLIRTPVDPASVRPATCNEILAKHAMRELFRVHA